jgi:N-acyl-D-amino-acid deacylase
LDLIIKNGYIIDGSGDSSPFKQWVKGDVGITEDIITVIGALEKNEARTIIDATNKIVCPGFIDVHTHSDFTILVNPKAESRIRQGVTTDVIGSCGFGPSPILEKGSMSIDLYELDLDWSSTDGYIKRLNHTGSAINILPMVGHVNIRSTVMGFDDRTPTKSELNEMKELLRKEMDEGSWGFSTGLISQPSIFADKEEIIELYKVVAEKGGVCKTHMRGGGDRVFAATLEAIETSKRSGARLIIHHHKAMGDRNANKVLITIPLIDKANSEGADIYMDMYPYLSGQANLWAALPPWVREGGEEKIVERLKEPEIRTRVKMEMLEPMLVPDWESYYAQTGPDFWDTCRIVACKNEHNKWMSGKTFNQAKPEWQDPFDFIFDLLIDEGGNVPFILPDVIQESDEYLRVILRHPRTIFGSDGYALDTYSSLSRWAYPHPRSFGTFPRIFKKYVKETRDFTWSEAIRKMTSLPASFMGLKDRGLIREGMYADIVVFDPNKIADRATIEKPTSYPIGIEYVIVNGKIVLENDVHTGNLPAGAIPFKA